MVNTIFRGLRCSVFLALSLATLRAFGQDATTDADSLLIREIERELSGEQPTDTQTQASQRRSRNTLNPAISVIGDFRAHYISDAERNVDVEMHEMETVLNSAVDPYVRADFFVSIAHEDGEFAFELEEAFLTTLSLPARLQVKAGKFRSTFGKINRIHPHALPFIDIPLAYANYLGEEGLNDQGASINWLIPNSKFYQEAVFEITRGPEESPSFSTDDGNRLLYAGRLRNFWDITRNATFEVGFSGVTGRNESGGTTTLGGLDFTYIWKPLQFNVYQSLTLQSETIFARHTNDAGAVVNSWGFYGLLRYKFARRWQATMKLDHSDRPDDASLNENAVSLTLGFLTSEYQKIELGLRTVSSTEEDRFFQAVVRAVFVIGAHGAHEY